MPAAVTFEDAVGRLRTPRPLRIRMHRRWMLEQRRHHPPALLNPVLSGEALAIPGQRRVQEHLVGRRALATLGGELHIEVDLLRLDRLVALSVDQEPDPVEGSILTTS